MHCSCIAPALCLVDCGRGLLLRRLRRGTLPSPPCGPRLSVRSRMSLAVHAALYAAHTGCCGGGGGKDGAAPLSPSTSASKATARQVGGRSGTQHRASLLVIAPLTRCGATPMPGRACGTACGRNWTLPSRAPSRFLRQGPASQGPLQLRTRPRCLKALVAREGMRVRGHGRHQWGGEHRRGEERGSSEQHAVQAACTMGQGGWGRPAGPPRPRSQHPRSSPRAARADFTAAAMPPSPGIQGFFMVLQWRCVTCGGTHVRRPLRAAASRSAAPIVTVAPEQPQSRAQMAGAALAHRPGQRRYDTTASEFRTTRLALG